MTHLSWNPKWWLAMVLALGLLSSCFTAPVKQTPTLIPSSSPTPPPTAGSLSADQLATLSSLEQLDDHPLYTMRYVGTYAEPALSSVSQPAAGRAARPIWGCALFAALGDPAQRLYGRTFDWRPSPAVLLFTDPPDGYASVSMVDIEYLGFTGSRAENLLKLPLEERAALLEAPALTFDGMNDQGVAVGMAAVAPGGMQPDPNKRTIDELAVMREILDHASSVDEALTIFERYNVDMGNVPLHYLVASAAGNSALVEFYEGKMVVFQNDGPWQLATNFLVASMAGRTAGECPRYDRIEERLQELDGRLNPAGALRLLGDVSQGGAQAQSTTQWSVVYDMVAADIHIVTDREYSARAHTLHLSAGK